MLTTQPFDDRQVSDAMEFLGAANRFSTHTWGWDTGRLVDWRWAGNVLRDRADPGFFGRNGSIVRRNGTVVALVFAEDGGDGHCILTADEDAALFETLLSGLLDRRDGEATTLSPSDGATWIHEILRSYGFVRGDVGEVGWGYDLTGRELLPASPPGFVIDHVRSEDDHPEVARCLEGAFGGEGDRIAMLRSIAANPWYVPELDVVARSDDGRIASYCRGTVDASSGVASIDPVATHPDFQGRGLGRAVVVACFAAQAQLGGRESYIVSGPDGSAGSRLYRRLDPVSKIDFAEWSRPPV